ncbi:hypothetical protein [Scytonema sp. PCC 10023]
MRCAKYSVPRGDRSSQTLKNSSNTGTGKILLGKVLLLVLKSAIAPPIV